MNGALLVVEGYPWVGQPTGGVFYQTQAQALSRLGLDVTVVSPIPWTPWPLSRLRPRWRRYSNTPGMATDRDVIVIRPRYVTLPGEPGWAFPDRLIARAAFRERRHWRQVQVIHGHSAMTGLAAWRLARRTGLPFVITFHGGDLNNWPDRHPDRVADLQAAARDARAILAVSAALAARARSITGVNAVHLPLGSDHRALAALAMPRAEARASLGLPGDRIVVLFVGNLLRAKGVRELADAIVALGERFLGVFVGDGPERGYRGTDPRHPACLEYRGARPHEEIARYMSAADVLVLPSHSEGLPTVLVEAGSLGLPVIASAVGGIPALLGGDRGTILRDVSAEAIEDALETFERNRPGAEASAARLREYVLAEHDVDLNTGRLIEHYGL